MNPAEPQLSFEAIDQWTRIIEKASRKLEPADPAIEEFLGRCHRVYLIVGRAFCFADVEMLVDRRSFIDDNPVVWLRLTISVGSGHYSCTAELHRVAPGLEVPTVEEEATYIIDMLKERFISSLKRATGAPQ